MAGLEIRQLPPEIQNDQLVAEAFGAKFQQALVKQDRYFLGVIVAGLIGAAFASVCALGATHFFSWLVGVAAWTANDLPFVLVGIIAKLLGAYVGVRTFQRWREAARRRLLLDTLASVEAASSPGTETHRWASRQRALYVFGLDINTDTWGSDTYFRALVGLHLAAAPFYALTMGSPTAAIAAVSFVNGFAIVLGWTWPSTTEAESKFTRPKKSDGVAESEFSFAVPRAPSIASPFLMLCLLLSIATSVGREWHMYDESKRPDIAKSAFEHIDSLAKRLEGDPTLVNSPLFLEEFNQTYRATRTPIWSLAVSMAEVNRGPFEQSACRQLMPSPGQRPEHVQAYIVCSAQPSESLDDVLRSFVLAGKAVKLQTRNSGW